MTEFSLGVPGEEDVTDALEGIEQILWLDEIGEIDLAPCLTSLLLQLEETLSETPITPLHPAGQVRATVRRAAGAKRR